MTERLRIDHKTLLVVDDFLRTKQKIKAIKKVRDITRASLRHAKIACDHRFNEIHGTPLPNKTPEAILATPWSVDKISMISPEGKKVEFNLESLELVFLQEMTNISLDEVADLLDLTEYIKNWQSRGYSGYVPEEDKMTKK